MTFFPQKKVFDYDEPSEEEGLRRFTSYFFRPGGARHAAMAVLLMIVLVVSLGYFLFVRHVPFSVYSEVRPDAVLIGETVRCDITVIYDRDDKVELTVPEGVFASFTVRGIDTAEGGFLRKKTLKKTYLLTRYSPGEAEVGQVEVCLRGKGPTGLKTAKTSPISVTFRSLLPRERVIRQGAVVESKYFTEGERNAMPGGAMGGEDMSGGSPLDGPIRLYIKDKAEPLTIPTMKDIGFLALGALIAVALVIFAGLTVYATLKAAGEKPPLLPHEAALAGLSGLKAARTLSGEKDLYSRLYTVMTDYVKAVYAPGTANLTVKEFLAFLGTIAALTVGQKQYIEKLVTACELVKYSGGDPPPGEFDGLLDSAIAFVNETKPKVAA